MLTMKNKLFPKIEFFIDGACRGNPGVGGWGILLKTESQAKSFYGAEANTTNNRMELTAAIMAIKSLKLYSESHDITQSHIMITTDSEYVKKGITEWLAKWEKRKWLTTAKTPVKNSDLWQQLAQTSKPYAIKWHWVRGHNGHLGNECADQLANRAIDEWLSR